MTDTHSLFCPICMYYFSTLYRLDCCSHHVCHQCVTDWFRAKNVTVPTLSASVTASDTGCPHCGSQSFCASTISQSQRKYEDSPAVAKQLAHKHVLAPSGLAQPSPLKPGDSFEKQRLKMTTFESAGMGAQAPHSCSPVPTLQEAPSRRVEKVYQVEEEATDAGNELGGSLRRSRPSSAASRPGSAGLPPAHPASRPPSAKLAQATTPSLSPRNTDASSRTVSPVAVTNLQPSVEADVVRENGDNSPSVEPEGDPSIPQLPGAVDAPSGSPHDNSTSEEALPAQQKRETPRNVEE